MLITTAEEVLLMAEITTTPYTIPETVLIAEMA
jgi:hypothetical protein